MFEDIRANAQQLDIVTLRGGVTKSPGSMMTDGAILYFVEFTEDFITCSFDVAMTRKQIVSPFAVLMITRAAEVIYKMDPRNMVFGGNI